MQLLDQHFEIQARILDYFGYDRGFDNYPMVDNRQSYWKFPNCKFSTVVVVSQDRDKVINATGADDDAINYHMIAYEPKEECIFVGEEYTLLLVDDEYGDNNIFLIVSNDKRVE